MPPPSPGGMVSWSRDVPLPHTSSPAGVRCPWLPRVLLSMFLLSSSARGCSRRVARPHIRTSPRGAVCRCSSGKRLPADPSPPVGDWRIAVRALPRGLPWTRSRPVPPSCDNWPYLTLSPISPGVVINVSIAKFISTSSFQARMACTIQH